MDVDRFKRKGLVQYGPRIRRKKRRLKGGGGFPTDQSMEKVKEMAREKIASGEVTVGERIVPRKVVVRS